ncbi:MAG TPA: cytochrome c-type biogenesis protein [Acidimicrobiia bacterium]|nr:cytochrome c-type biogenesis protein [Acidimicrobiia bacterium]
MAWPLIVAVAVASIVVLLVRSHPSNSVAARTKRLEQQLACPVCQGESVADSNAPEARDIRNDIPRRIAAGQSDGQIRAAYVERYGERILLSPSGSGLGIVAWVIPSLAVLLGGAGIVLALRRWSRTPRLAASAEDERIVRDALERAPAPDEDAL